MSQKRKALSEASIQTIRGILFDKDGTLFDFHRTWLPVVREAAIFASGGDTVLANVLLTGGGLDFSTGRFLPDSIIAAGHAGELAECWVHLGAVRSQSILHERIDYVFSRLGLAHAVPVTDLKRHFTFLKNRGLLAGVASNDSEAAVISTVEQFGLSDLVCFLAGYNSGYGPKPGPGMVRAFCRVTGLSPEEVAVVGDSEHDMLMGRRAGAGLLVGVLTGAGTRQSLRDSAHLIIEDVSCLKDLIVKS